LYPAESAPRSTLFFISVAWFVQVIFIPLTFAIDIAAAMAASDDALDVVLNGLALTFILEVDNLLFRYLLSRPQQESYRHIFSIATLQTSPNVNKDAEHRNMICLVVVDILMMWAQYLIFVSAGGFSTWTKFHGVQYLDQYLDQVSWGAVSDDELANLSFAAWYVAMMLRAAFCFSLRKHGLGNVSASSSRWFTCWEAIKCAGFGVAALVVVLALLFGMVNPLYCHFLGFDWMDSNIWRDCLHLTYNSSVQN